MAAWDETNPLDNAIVSQFPANERAARAAVKTNFAVDHHEAADANVGQHDKVTVLEQGSDEAAVADAIVIYAKEVSGVTELFSRDSGGNILQLTTAGTLNGAGLKALSVATAAINDLAVTTAKLAADAVTYAKIQNVSATDKVLGRSTAGAGDVEEIAMTAAGRALVDDASAVAQRLTLGFEAKYKTADQVVSSSSYVNDTHLTGLTLAANGVYSFEAVLYITTGGADFPYTKLVQTQTPFDSNFAALHLHSLNGTNDDVRNVASATTDLEISWAIAGGTQHVITIRGLLNGGSSGGTVKIQHKENTAQSLTIQQGSFMELRRLDA